MQYQPERRRLRFLAMALSYGHCRQLKNQTKLWRADLGRRAFYTAYCLKEWDCTWKKENQSYFYETVCGICLELQDGVSCWRTTAASTLMAV